MIVSTIPLRPRIDLIPFRSEDILSYGIDNAYPQRVKQMVGQSGTATSCVRLFKKFISGRGFKDETFAGTIINCKGVTTDKLLKRLAKDYAMFYGFAVHVNYNALYQPVEFNFIPFENIRFRLPANDWTDTVTQFAVYEDWGRTKWKVLKRDKIEYIDCYNPDPNVIQQQVEMAGSWQDYKGQIFYHSNEGDMVYPLAPYDSVLESIDADAQIQVFKQTNIRTNFMASTVFVHKGKFETKEKREEFVEGLTEFQGAESAGKILLLEVETDDQVPDLKPFVIQNYDTIFEVTGKTIKDDIIQVFTQPQVLNAVQTAGKLGTSNEILDAERFYDKQTAEERLLFEATFASLFKNWYNPNVNISKNYSITPVSGLVSVTNKPKLVDSLDVESIKALLGMLQPTGAPKMSPQQLVNALVLIFGASVDDATAIVNGTDINAYN